MMAENNLNKESVQKKNQYMIVAFFMLISLFAVIILFALYAREDDSLSIVSLDSFKEGDPSNLLYDIEAFQYDSDGACLVNGWAIKPGVTYHFYNYGNDAERNTVYNNMRIGFTDGESVYIMPTKLEQRTDVNELINDGIDYAYCGFRSRLPVRYTESVEYNIVVLIWQNPDGTQELYYLE